MYHKTLGERAFKEFIASPVLDINTETLSEYSFSDTYFFHQNALLPTVTHVTLLRNQSGIYEKYDIKRMSIERPGQFIPIGSFVRAAAV